MKIIKCLILALILQVRIYQAEIVIPTSSPDKSSSMLVKGLVKIVTSCFEDRITAVGLAGNLPDTLSRTLSDHLIPITLMDCTSHLSHPRNLKTAPPLSRYELQVFIIGASSYEQLSRIVQISIRSSIWWNHMASFFILDQSTECVNIYSFLWVAWQLHILNAKVMCYHHKKRGYLFNYNPFTSQAPVPWQHPMVFKGINKHPFTLFHQKWDKEMMYQRNGAICVNLDFLKTKNLGRYEIRIEGKPMGFKDSPKEWNDIGKAVANLETLVYTVYRALNVTPKFSGIFRDPIPSDIEMSLNYITPQIVSKTTYPYQSRSVVLVSKFRGHKSQLEKILCVIDFDSRTGMGIVYLVTLIFFRFFVRQALGPTLLNLVRITCNMGFTNLRDNTAHRMYLTGLLFFVVTLQGIYQGNLASLLTNIIPYSNVNSVKDVVNWGYKVYTPGHLSAVTKQVFKHANLKEPYIITVDVTGCIVRMVNDSSAACMAPAHAETFDLARMYDLHLSNEIIHQTYVSFVIKRWWYLEEQVNTILGKIMEADIFETWESKCNPTNLDDFKFDKEVRNNKDFKIIEIAELAFAFVILGIGLLCATVSFIVEVGVYRYQQHNNNTIIVLNARYDRDRCACRA